MMKTNSKKVIQGIIITLSIGFIAFGICSDEVKVVFEKSIKLCLECVGIG